MLEHKLYAPPEPVGWWEITPAPICFRVASASKPNWFRRKMHKIILGWDWVNR